MKRLFFIVLVLSCVVVCLSSCKSEAVKEVERQIAGIVVNEDCGDAIKAAKKSYDMLSDKEKEAVSNYRLLIDCETDYNIIKAEEVETLIQKIKYPIDAECGTDIDAARAGFEALSKEQQKYVKNYDDLISAEQEYQSFMVKYCADLISNLQSGKLDAESIEYAQSVYNSLSEEQQRAVRGENTDVEAVFQNAYIRRTASLIDSISYKGEEPTKEEVREMIAAVEAYNALNELQRKQVENYASLEKATKAFEKFNQTRIKTDKQYAKRQYIAECEEVDYDTLLMYPKASKGKQIFLEVSITHVEKGLFSSAIYAVSTVSNHPVVLNDSRREKEPAIKAGDNFVVYGVADGNDKIAVKEENREWFGENVAEQSDEKIEIPVIDFVYTNQKNPYESEVYDTERDDLIEYLMQIISE